MGKLTNLNLSKALTEADMPPGMATDTETAAAIAGHVGAADPHSQYEFRASLASKILTGSRSFPANTWTSLGAFSGFPLGVQGLPSAILIGISFCFDSSSPWQQACCAALLGPIWWQSANTADAGVRVWLEFHNQTGFFISIRCGGFSGDLRSVLVNPETTISIPATGRVDVALKKLL
jgi:hypothetical protein